MKISVWSIKTPAVFMETELFVSWVWNFRESLLRHPSFLVHDYEAFKARSTYISRGPQCPSPRPNWNPPHPLPQASMFFPLGTKWGGDTLACGWGSGGVPIRTTGEKAFYTVKRVDEVVRHPHLVTQDQFTQVSKSFRHPWRKFYYKYLTFPTFFTSVVAMITFPT
jgi:hypothetical protein